MTTGQIIKALREERGMTQEQVAELMGYSHKSSINKIELGKSDLPQSKLVAFAKIFGVSPCELLGLDPQPATEEQVKEWDEKFNSKLELQNEVLLIEGVQKKFGKKAVQLLELFEQLNNQGKSKAIDTLSDLTDILKYTQTEKVYEIKKAARNGSFEEKSITDSELQDIKDLPDVDDLK